MTCCIILLKQRSTVECKLLLLSEEKLTLLSSVRNNNVLIESCLWPKNSSLDLFNLSKSRWFSPKEVISTKFQIPILGSTPRGGYTGVIWFHEDVLNKENAGFGWGPHFTNCFIYLYQSRPYRSHLFNCITYCLEQS